MSLGFKAMTQLLSRQQPELLPVDGARLQRIGPQCWIADRELAYGRRATLPVRMTVTSDRQAGLTLYSPLALDEGTREALAGLGEVVRVVAPNRFHTLFAQQVLDAYPNAELLVPRESGDLLQRFPARTTVVSEQFSPDSGLELYPVQLREGLTELCAYHDASESLILADLLFNLQQASSSLARFLYRLNGIWQRPGHSYLQRLLLFRERESLRLFYRWALAKPFAQIVMAHGQIITSNARELFYRTFSRYSLHYDVPPHRLRAARHSSHRRSTFSSKD